MLGQSSQKMNADMFLKKMDETTDPREKLRYLLLSGGMKSLNGLIRCFRINDEDRSRSLDLKEFTKGMNVYSRGKLSDDQIKQIFSMADKDGSGSIDIDELLVINRLPLNPTRLAIVEEAFQKVEKYMNGELELNQRQTREMNDHFNLNQDEKITKDEFVDYYTALSRDMNNDAHFVIMVKQSWEL